jgi:MFS family permease
MILGYFLVSGYQLYILTDYIPLPHGMRPATGVTILAAISTLCSILAAAVAGPLSDRLDRRKVFVFVSAAISGGAMILPIVSPAFGTMIVFAVLAGLAFGSYMAVDTAIVTLVLPRREDAARDLGILNIANAGPQVIAPLVAAVVIDNLGGYRSLFAAGGLVAIAGAFAILPVRSVR